MLKMDGLYTITTTSYFDTYDVLTVFEFVLDTLNVTDVEVDRLPLDPLVHLRHHLSEPLERLRSGGHGVNRT